MFYLDAGRLAGLLDFAALVDALDAAFRGGATVPPRHHHTVPVDSGRHATLLLMPAWDEAFIGIKTATVMPENTDRGLPGVHATYQLLDRPTGQVLTSMDGAELTARRTAAASALASRYLSRPKARRLTMVGTGVLAPHLIRAHASQREIAEVVIWGRDTDKAAAVARGFNDAEFSARAEADLEAAVDGADIISCATMATEPLVRGAWLQPGQHLDLVGGFTPLMRETDDEALGRAEIFVDTDHAVTTAGDICDPIKRGVISDADIKGTLFTLCRAETAGRLDADSITLFKSAGTAIEDLAAAVLAYGRA